MKNLHATLLVLITVFFLGTLTGFYQGRQISSVQIQISENITSSATDQTETTASTQDDTVSEAASSSTVSFPININTASIEELTAIPGIGTVYATRIVEYRNQHGSFANINDLIYVYGIGVKRLESIKPYITIGE